jgi:hypothetical protein
MSGSRNLLLGAVLIAAVVVGVAAYFMTTEDGPAPSPTTAPTSAPQPKEAPAAEKPAPPSETTEPKK